MVFEPEKGLDDMMEEQEQRSEAARVLRELLKEEDITANDEVTFRRQHDGVEVVTIIGRGLVSNFYVNDGRITSSEQKPYEEAVILQKSYETLHEARATAVENAFTEAN